MPAPTICSSRPAAPLLAVMLAVCLLAPGAARGEVALPAGQEGARQSPLPAVSTVSAIRDFIADRIVATGAFVAREEILVGSEADGYAVDEILADVGDEVRKGQVLARLSRDRIDAQIAQNEAAVQRAEAAIGQASAQLEEAIAGRDRARASLARTRSLQGGGIASPDTLEQRAADAKAAEARARAAEQVLRVAEADLAAARSQGRELIIRADSTEIRAPGDGLVSRRQIHLGETVSSASPALFHIIGNSEIEVEARVPESALPRLRAGQAARVAPAGSPDELSATIRQVAPEISDADRLGRVRLRLARSPGDGPFTLGSYARVTFETERRVGVLVPVSAVLSGIRGSRVQVVRDGVVETRAVETGLRSGGLVEIRRGITDGERVLSRSGSFVRDGDPVREIRER